MKTTAAQLAELERFLEAVRPTLALPLRCRDAMLGNYKISDNSRAYFAETLTKVDADLAVAAVNLAPSLLADLKEEQSKIERLELAVSAFYLALNVKDDGSTDHMLERCFRKPAKLARAALEVTR